MAVLTTGYHLQMFFSSQEGGWSEKLLLKSTSKDTAETDAVVLLNFRRNCLPFNMNIEYARMTSIGDKRLARSVGSSFPLAGDFGFATEPDPGDDPTPPVDPAPFVVNTTRDALCLKMESADWNWSLRYMHGVPDPRVNDDKLVSAITIADADPGAYVQYGAATWPDRVGNYMWQIRNLCYLETFGPRTSDGRAIIGTAIQRLTVRKSTGRKVGSPFGQSRGRAVPR